MVANQRKTSFATEVEQALKHYQDPEWMGANSPLASPYFLGRRLPASAVESNARGEHLQRLLTECTDALTGRYAGRYQTIIREYYFNNQTVKVVCQQINLGHNSFHLSRHEAIVALAELLIKQMNPALRLETPPQHGVLWERATILEQSLAAIHKHQSVTLLGSSGQGKSVLGSSIALASQRACFWYTIRRGLNDQLEALLFALGYFLHECGSSTLWLELVAEGGNLKPERLTAIIRYALEQLRPVPLLCIDEIEQLMPSEEANHVPIIRLLESLRGRTAAPHWPPACGRNRSLLYTHGALHGRHRAIIGRRKLPTVTGDHRTNSRIHPRQSPSARTLHHVVDTGRDRR